MLDMLVSMFIKNWQNKSKIDKTTITSRKFCCYKVGYGKEVEWEGKKSRMEVRVGCEAHMVISHWQNGKYHVTIF